MQGTLLGMFDGEGEEDEEPTFDIDASYTQIMIPDPQPRNYPKQAELEKKLASSESFLSKESSMAELAKSASDALRSSGLLAPEADSISFGVGEEKDAFATHSPTLPWGQLSELTKCLLVRDMLPSSISSSNQKAIMEHTAQRWFSLLRFPNLSKLAFGPFVRLLASEVDDPAAAKVTIFSAHDSTLIGVITALRLANPSKWPEYASHFKVEVFSEVGGERGGGKRLARFSLNGEVLRHLELEGEMIPFEDVVRLALGGGKDEGIAEKEL